jgi:hypothetical protein
MVVPTKLRIGSRVRFVANFTFGGEVSDPKSVTATVTKAGTEQRFTMKTGIERTGKGEYQLLVTADVLGLMIVRFTESGGETHKETYEVMSKAEAPPVTADRVDAGTVWPRGFTRELALVAMRMDGEGQSDAFVLGALEQHLRSDRAATLMNHDDSKPLPDPDDEARAKSVTAERLAKARRNVLKVPERGMERKLLVDARREIRLDRLRR